jgi:peptidoglycan/xylan/chitin deacetylase (PgdA/CDA1 family)
MRLAHPLSPIASTNLVLTLHAVPSAAWLQRTLELVGSMYRFISAADLRAYLYGGATFNSACHLTFDDGDRTFYDVAWPVLRSMGVPATLFVAPGILARGENYWFQDMRHLRRQVGDQAFKEALAQVTGWPPDRLAPYGVSALIKQLQLEDIRRLLDSVQEGHAVQLPQGQNMSPEEVVEVDRSDVASVGAHTMHHPILQNESTPVAAQEIGGSLAALAAWLGRPVDSFAYPNGIRGLDFGPREERLVRDSGAHLAFTTRTAFLGKATGPLAIPRVALSAADGESRGRILARLALVPVWNRLRPPGEIRERQAIQRRLPAQTR